MVCGVPFHERDSFPFHGMGDNHSRSVSHILRFFQRVYYLAKVIAVNFQDVPIERLPLVSTGSVGMICSVRPSCWIPFLSTIAVRLSSLNFGAAIAASQVSPSSSSPWPRRSYTRWSFLSTLPARAMPIAAERPIPKEPPGNSTPGTLWSGWPCRRLLIFLRVLSSLVGRYPASARVENRTGAACPLDRTNRSRSGQSERLGSCRIL